MAAVRPAAVAGMFYPGEAGELDAAVRGYLAAAATEQPPPKAVIAPHAGYVYSGAVAAAAYAPIAAARERIERVVLLGPAHRVPFRGLAAANAAGFATPLGTVPVDVPALKRVLALPQVVVLNEAHRLEHSLEVHLPFLQRVLNDFRVVPLVVGEASPAQVAEVLDALWGGPETLVVISSDLSHYLDYDAARQIDAATCRAIEGLDPDAIAHEQACGRIPITGLLRIARERGMAVTTVDLRNSGDTAGPRDRVVGYGSWLFHEGAARPEPGPSREGEARSVIARHGGTLLRIALTSVVYGLTNDKPLPVDPTKYPAPLRGDGATFVTLTRGGKLRGCIGTVIANRPLVADVAVNGYNAAFKDQRFKPLSESELDVLDLEVSLLSAPEPIAFTDQADLLAQLRPGVDGVILSDGGRRGLFLPSVWQQIPKRDEFLAQLKVKAGLPADHWSSTVKAHRFTTVSTAFSKLGPVH